MQVRIEHIALWTEDIERLASFYERYFGATPGSRYANPPKGFQSLFLSSDSGARIELMKTTRLMPPSTAPAQSEWV
jgi:lactoylglutathione lyase